MNFKEFLSSKSITEEQFKGKSAEELAGLYNEYNEKRAEDLTALVEGKASKEDIDSLKAEISKGQAEQMKHLNATLKEYGVAIKKLTQAEKEAGVGTLSSVRKGLEDNKEVLSKMAAGEGARVSFQVS